VILECHKCNRLFDRYFGAICYRRSQRFRPAALQEWLE
jgi:hypothetical protein